MGSLPLAPTVRAGLVGKGAEESGRLPARRDFSAVLTAGFETSSIRSVKSVTTQPSDFQLPSVCRSCLSLWYLCHWVFIWGGAQGRTQGQGMGSTRHLSISSQNSYELQSSPLGQRWYTGRGACACGVRTGRWGGWPSSARFLLWLKRRALG